jgi:hypothetical protein
MALAACGGERTFTAEEFVGAANDEGAGIALGEQLYTSVEGAEVFAITLSAAGGSGASSGDGHAHGGASMTVLADAADAVAEHQACEGAGEFVCYRAANVALAIQGQIAPGELAALDAAIRALASD